MKKNRFSLTESRLHRVIKESVKNVLKEASLPKDQMKGQQIIDKISMLVKQANEACEANIAEWGGQDCLMDKDANYYGINGKIRLLMNGYLVIPFNGDKYWSTYQAEKIKVFTKSGGRYKLYHDEWDYDWRDAKKMLIQIINDAQRFKSDMEGYNPEWEDEETKNPQAVHDFNKKIGVRVGARKP